MPDFAVLVPVGPGALEADRAVDLVSALGAFEPSGGTLVVIDDDRTDRHLTARFDLPASWGVVRLPAARHPARRGKLGALCTSMLTGLGWIETFTSARFVLRLDTDALVIAPFADKLFAAVGAAPAVGCFGSFDVTCDGGVRDFSPHRRLVRRLASPLVPTPRRSRRRDVVRAALAHGYEPGEHCLGAACVMTREWLSRMRDRGHLDDTALWHSTSLPDDVMLGLYTRAVGLRSASMTGDGEPFGLKYIGLPDSPRRLLDRGFSFVHSVKSDPRWTEADIRAVFRGERRGAVQARESSTRRAARGALRGLSAR